MRIAHRAVRRGAVAGLLIALASLGACKSAGSLGEVLGSVLGGQGQGNQLAGTIAGVDTRGQRLGIQQGNGQTVAVGYDNNTRVIYQNQNYPVTALEAGDQVIARILDRGDGAYYTDSVYVARSVSSTGGTGSSAGSEAVQAVQGVVRQIDQSNGLFALEVSGGRVLTVSMPYRARNADVNRFQNLRTGESVRLAGVFLNNSRVELRQFY
jgi:hypothetical protein